MGLVKLGLIGKTNTGKTTLFNAATLLRAEVSTYPFTTKQPNIGKAYVQTVCVCREFKVADNPINSLCIEGQRFIPIELVDLPGLIKGSWMGKGLGVRFLSVAAQADALLHVVDASGSVDAEGNITKPGMGNPILDYYDIEEELARWFFKIVKRSVEKTVKRGKNLSQPEKELYKDLAGMKVSLGHISQALAKAKLVGKDIKSWDDEDILDLSKSIRELSKPTIIVANKMDLAPAEKNYQKLVEEFKGHLVVPCSSEAELALRRAEEKGLIKYVPGEEGFRVVDRSGLTPEQTWALSYVESRVFNKWMRTGVQLAINLAVFKLLGMNVVYPVEDAEKLADGRGNVLPDAFLVGRDASVKDLAGLIHTDLAESLLYAIDVRTGVRLPKEYILRDRDVISLVAAGKRG